MKKLTIIGIPLLVSAIYFFLPFLLPSTTNTEKALLSHRIYDKLMTDPQVSIEKLQSIIDEELSKRTRAISINVFDELRYIQSIDYLKNKGGQKFIDILNKKIGESSKQSTGFRFEMKHEDWVKIYSTFFVFIFTLILMFFEKKAKDRLDSEIRQKTEDVFRLKDKIDSSQKLIDSFKQKIMYGNNISQNNMEALLNILGEKTYIEISKENQNKLLEDTRKLNGYQDIKL